MTSWQAEALLKIILTLDKLETPKGDTGLEPSTKDMECLCLQKLSWDEVGWCGCEANRNREKWRAGFTGRYYHFMYTNL